MTSQNVPFAVKSAVAKRFDCLFYGYEVAPEDFALAEYADSSKQPLQQMVRNGLDYLRHEVE